jgi:hypothetical protein
VIIKRHQNEIKKPKTFVSGFVAVKEVLSLSASSQWIQCFTKLNFNRIPMRVLEFSIVFSLTNSQKTFLKLNNLSFYYK